MDTNRHWVGTWAIAPAPSETGVGFNNHTVRMHPRVSSTRRCLWLGSRWGGARGHVRPARPDQHGPLFVHRQPLALNEFGLQILQIVVIQVKLALEGAIRHAPAALQEGNRLIEEFLKGHR